MVVSYIRYVVSQRKLPETQGSPKKFEKAAHQVLAILTWFTVEFMCHPVHGLLFHCVSLESASCVTIACLVDDQSRDEVLMDVLHSDHIHILRTPECVHCRHWDLEILEE